MMWLHPTPTGGGDAEMHQVQFWRGVGIRVDAQGNAHLDRLAGMDIVEVQAFGVGADL